MPLKWWCISGELECASAAHCEGGPSSTSAVVVGVPSRSRAAGDDLVFERQSSCVQAAAPLEPFSWSQSAGAGASPSGGSTYNSNDA